MFLLGLNGMLPLKFSKKYSLRISTDSTVISEEATSRTAGKGPILSEGNTVFKYAPRYYVGFSGELTESESSNTGSSGREDA